MRRIVFVSSLGIAVLGSSLGASAQAQTKVEEPKVAAPSGLSQSNASTPQLSRAKGPFSAIAASQFALGQRDSGNQKAAQRPRVLQVSLPVAPTATPVATQPAQPASTPSAPATTTKTNSVKGQLSSNPAVAPLAGTPEARPTTVSVKAKPTALEATAPDQTTRTVPVVPSVKTPAASATPKTPIVIVALPSKGATAVEPKTGTSVVPSAPTATTGPKKLASREAIAQRLLLARLDADLAREEKRLDRAQARLTDGQRQLGTVNDILRSAMLEAGPDARGLHPFVRVAQRYLGTPYVWGGESARGFDCSGFIMRVMRDLGYRALPHSAAEQFRYGTPIAKELLQPGDIVFFANTYKPGISHVGIYLGRGRFIHAANSKVGTIVSNLNEAKWVEHYAGARRLVRAS